MKRPLPFLIAVPALLCVVACSKPAGPDTLTDAERSAGWEMLFDGKSFDGWHGYNGQGLQSWKILEFERWNDE
jgi:hypothetical protein